MTGPASRIVALVASASQVPSASRQELEPALLAAAGRDGGALIRTCHRIEWYLETDGDPVVTLAATGTRVPQGSMTLSGVDAVARLVSLALGLESVVLGEDQILHQMRRAVADARARGPFGGELGHAFDAALRAGRLGRTWCPTRPVSIADVGIREGERQVGPVAGRLVLVVGSGEMGTLAARAARARGARVAVASRRWERAAEAATRVNAEAWPFDAGEALREPALIVVALAGPWNLAPGSELSLAGGPVIVDLSMPAALPARTVEALGARYVGIDHLASDSPAAGPASLPEEPATRRYRERLLGLRESTLASYRERVTRREPSTAARVLAERVERERQDLLDALFRGRPNLEPADQAAIDAMTARLTGRLFGSVLERLARGDEGGRRVVRDVFGL